MFHVTNIVLVMLAACDMIGMYVCCHAIMQFVFIFGNYVGFSIKNLSVSIFYINHFYSSIYYKTYSPCITYSS